MIGFLTRCVTTDSSTAFRREASSDNREVAESLIRDQMNYLFTNVDLKKMAGPEAPQKPFEVLDKWVSSCPLCVSPLTETEDLEGTPEL